MFYQFTSIAFIQLELQMLWLERYRIHIRD